MTNIFSRFADIISSNINSMLDKAEDPEKMLRLMINEMEDTLIEIKADCAGAIATKKKIQRALEESRVRAEGWNGKAELAVNKGREDLAREALLEKRRYMDRARSLEVETDETQAIVDQYKAQIEQLEAKIASAREKQRLLVQRAVHAQGRKKAQADIRRYDASEAMARFEQFENRIERMEAEADLVNFGRKPVLDEEFAQLQEDEDLEKELNELKTKASHRNTQS
jgi:phage shock protein A